MNRRHTPTKDARLAATELFFGLSCTQLAFASANTTGIALPAGTDLLREGQAGRELLVIESGEAVVTIDGQPIAVLRAGSYAGEIAVLAGIPRIATVTAITAIEVFVMTTREVATLMARIPETRARLDETATTRLAQLAVGALGPDVGDRRLGDVRTRASETRPFVVVGTGVDPVTFRFSGGRSAD